MAAAVVQLRGRLGSPGGCEHSLLYLNRGMSRVGQNLNQREARELKRWAADRLKSFSEGGHGSRLLLHLAFILSGLAFILALVHPIQNPQ